MNLSELQLTYLRKTISTLREQIEIANVHLIRCEAGDYGDSKAAKDEISSFANASIAEAHDLLSLLVVAQNAVAGKKARLGSSQLMMAQHYIKAFKMRVEDLELQAKTAFKNPAYGHCDPLTINSIVRLANEGALASACVASTLEAIVSEHI